MLNYTSTSLPLTTELFLATKLYILLILFETHGHWLLSVIVTVSDKGIYYHAVHCNDTLSSVMIMKEILMMSGFKAIAVLKLCRCRALTKRRKKIRHRGHMWRKNNRHLEKYLTMQYLPLPSALPAETKTTPRVVGGGINKGENTAMLYAVCSVEAGASGRHLAFLLLWQGTARTLFPAGTTSPGRVGKLEKGTLALRRWHGLAGGIRQMG